jgi:hypothetical protein
MKAPSRIEHQLIVGKRRVESDDPGAGPAGGSAGGAAAASPGRHRLMRETLLSVGTVSNSRGHPARYRHQTVLYARPASSASRLRLSPFGNLTMPSRTGTCPLSLKGTAATA